MMANSPVVAFGPISKLGIEEFELAFDGLEREALRVGHDPAVGALEPLGRVAFHAIGDLRDADDADGFKGVRQICDAVAAFNVGKGFGRGVGFTLAGMDEHGTAQLGRPNPIFNVLIAIDDEPCPRLAGEVMDSLQ
jgi:hypothetical protein